MMMMMTALWAVIKCRVSDFSWQQWTYNTRSWYSGYFTNRSYRSGTCCSGETTGHWAQGGVLCSVI